METDKFITENNRQLPLVFKKYFWDCDFTILNLKDYIDFITVRILNYGNDESIKWLVSHIKRDTLIKIINKSRELDDKTSNYWSLMLND